MYAVYILVNRKHGTLYVGVTSNLSQRIWQHRSKAVPGFTRSHGVQRLVYFETTDSLLAARDREHRLKRWRRDWKLALIERDNPNWDDLYPTLEP